jgi:hypothetical protein
MATTIPLDVDGSDIAGRDTVVFGATMPTGRSTQRAAIQGGKPDDQSLLGAAAGAPKGHHRRRLGEGVLAARGRSSDQDTALSGNAWIQPVSRRIRGLDAKPWELRRFRHTSSALRAQ